tara:strand:+ start:65 stop:2335 length:2271 start_codon:yes stop_codon:yes gene_type:complete
MRIDNPTGFTSNLTGSFTGSFFGDGSGLTGTDSGSWDGDFTGSAEITGSLRITGSLDTTGVATFGGDINQSSGTLQIKNASGDSSGLKLYQAGSDVSTISNNYAGDIAFNTANTSQKMIIKNSGKVGIGRSPSRKLDVKIVNGSSNGVGFTNNADQGLEIFTDTDVANADVFLRQKQATSSMIFQMASTNVLTISSAGLLTINVAAASNPRLIFDGVDVTGVHYIQINRGTSAMEFYVNGATRATISSAGALTINASADDTGAPRAIGFGGNAIGTNPLIYRDNANNLVIDSANSAKLYLNGDVDGDVILGLGGGNVGVGTTTTSYDAAKIGTQHRFLNVQATSGNYAVGTLAGDSGTNGNRIGYLTFVNDNNSANYKYSAWVGAEIEGTTANQQGGRLIFSTAEDGTTNGPIERLRISSTGDATFSGNIIGNSSDTMEIGAFGTGAIKRIRMTQGGEIHFGDTTTLAPLGVTEGLWNDFSDADKLSLYCRNNLRIFTYPDATEKLIVQPTGIKASTPIYSSYVASLITPFGGTQDCRIIEDSLGKWIQVGRFAADAALTIQSTWSSVSGLSTGELQSETTQFSADWGNAYPTEVRIMGATNFTQWLQTRTIDFIYRVPTGRQWGTFFNAGNANGNVYRTPIGNKYGWDCAGTYDGFGRWNNPNQTQVGMSDNIFTNPSSAYSTPTSNAFNWNTAGDAKFTVIHNAVMSGQDNNLTSGVGADDGVIGFLDSFPNVVGNMGGIRTYSSAVWVLMKLN